jgi:hypothetical protein
MNDDSRVIDKGWDGLPNYADQSGDTDEAVTVSISTTPGEWLVNTTDAVVVPMSMAELVEGLRHGKLTERSLVWRAGMQEWAPVEKVPQLKLAAHLPIAPIKSVAPAASTVPPRPTPSKPPPKPVRASTPAPASVAPQHLPSRKATLPFGLPNPVASQSRPSSQQPSSPRNVAPAAPPRSEEPEVLAVYARPAATISFDLSPEQPLRAPASPAPAPPETLAPLTSESAPRRAPTPRNADLSVVAASQFREVQRSSKRLVWISSLASAAAASLLTFWLASNPAAPGGVAASRPAEPLAALSPAPAAAAPPAPSAAPEVTTSESAAPTPVVPPPTEVAVAKPKPTHKPRAVSVAAPKPPRTQADAQAAVRDPSAEPNPYDVKLDDEAPAPKATPAAAPARGSGLDVDKGSQASASSATSPGF